MERLFELEVTAEMTMRAVKEQLKRIHTWEDELSREHHGCGGDSLETRRSRTRRRWKS